MGRATVGREWIVGMGLPSLALGTGAAMMGFVNFWVGFCLTIVANLILVGDWLWLSEGRYRWATRVVVATAMIVPSTWVCWLAMRPAPLHITVQVGPVLNDREWAGIEWTGELMPLVVNIQNPTTRDYGSVDLAIWAGGHIFWRVKQTSESVGCQLFSGDQLTTPLGQMKFTDGSQSATPVAWFSKEYRVRCDKLPRLSSLEFMAALATLNADTRSASAFATASRPPALKMKIEYTDANKPVTLLRVSSDAELAGPPQ